VPPPPPLPSCPPRPAPVSCRVSDRARPHGTESAHVMAGPTRSMVCRAGEPSSRSVCRPGATQRTRSSAGHPRTRTPAPRQTRQTERESSTHWCSGARARRRWPSWPCRCRARPVCTEPARADPARRRDMPTAPAAPADVRRAGGECGLGIGTVCSEAELSWACCTHGQRATSMSTTAALCPPPSEPAASTMYPGWYVQSAAVCTGPPHGTCGMPARPATAANDTTPPAAVHQHPHRRDGTWTHSAEGGGGQTDRVQHQLAQARARQRRVPQIRQHRQLQPLCAPAVSINPCVMGGDACRVRATGDRGGPSPAALPAAACAAVPRPGCGAGTRRAVAGVADWLVSARAREMREEGSVLDVGELQRARGGTAGQAVEHGVPNLGRAVAHMQHLPSGGQSGLATTCIGVPGRRTASP
jgi:hypothetical protein